VVASKLALHKRKRRFSDTNFEIRKPCWCFNWML